MSRELYDHYIPECGPFLEGYKKYFDEVKSSAAVRSLLLEKIGAKNVIQAHVKIVGVQFENDTPPDATWRNVGKCAHRKPFFMPYQRSKAGKSLHKEISNLPTVDKRSLMSYLTADGSAEVMLPPTDNSLGFRIMTAYGGKIGGRNLVGIPKNANGTPIPVLDGARPIPLSDVYKMIEEHEKTTQA